MPFVVIMAGGRGERFWLRSRLAAPKQFLNLVGDKTMLQLTVERMVDLVGISDIYIVAGSDYKDIIMEQVPHLPEENILIEPCGRDTAAAIGLAALILERKDPREVMIVLPADHYISDVHCFRKVLKSAVVAACSGEEIVTIGIAPHRPETGYGYISQGEILDIIAGVPVYRVFQFLEKPDYAKAVRLLACGNYLWNSGMFIWRLDLIRRLIEKHTPQLARGLNKIGQAMGTGQYTAVLEEVYAKLPRISVDYGILEKADSVLVVPGDFGWDDIGSWIALERYAEKDERGNIIEGRGVMLDTSDTFIYSPGKTVGVIGVENLVVVNDRDSILVCRKDRTQEIKKVVQALKDKGLDEVL
ncbi:mannose-1-phosphate guanylyltransferase [Desulfoscipio gibsoniae]|uniref:mannose-1-phosphate guanylyltransferase n=1 Tax=Desulfoscipio gibsoniae DSM 7213 TaxID=767817 RepID=R4KN55_9FIRM|nr:mannose-1-phosphate guanylyltransferase [Desulfoscipio gibsoniae]AGL01041.1 mannose-1-phosphate guanylyltransferase [Desulfoscipio gibsoniae DSM 7213]